MEQIVELLLVVILGVMILFFVVGGGRNLGGLWDSFCKNNPQFCGGGDTSIEYSMSIQSASALRCAIDCVILGKKDPSDCTCLGTFKSAALGPTPSTNPLGVSGMQVDTSGLAKMEVDATVSCEEADPQTMGNIVIAASDIGSAEDFCKSTCTEDCVVKITDKGRMEDYLVQKDKTLVKCDCKCESGKKGSNLGLVAAHAEDICQERCGTSKATISNCENVDVNMDAPGDSGPAYYISPVKFYNELIKNDVEVLPVKGSSCKCVNKANSDDKHDAYGVGPEWAGDMCNAQDYKSDSISSSTHDTVCTDFEGNLLFYKDKKIFFYYNKKTEPNYDDTDRVISGFRKTPRYECEREIKTVKCTVNDFKLPQKISDVKTYIINYGDPKFIFYWNMFPIEENTWTFKPDWKVHALIAAVSILPPTKALGLVVKTGVKMAGTGAKNLLPKAFKSLGSPWLTSGGVTLPIMKTAAKKVGVMAIGRQVFKEKLKEIVSKRLTARGITRMVIKGAVLETAYHVAVLVDNMSEKYEPKGNNMVLKSPFEKAETYTLESKWEGSPVLVKWDKRPTFLHYTNLENAHLVSPCYLNEFEVYRKSVVCEKYSYVPSVGVTVCESPKEYDNKEYAWMGVTPDEHDKMLIKNCMECGTFSKKVDEFLFDGAYDKTVAFSKMSNKKIFEHVKSLDKTISGEDTYDMTKMKIYLPHKLKETGEVHYISDLKHVDKEEKLNLICDEIIADYDVWSGKLYKGSTQLKNIKMRCRANEKKDEFGTCIININDKDTDSNAFTEPFEYITIITDVPEKKEDYATNYYHSLSISEDRCYKTSERIRFTDDDFDGIWDSIEVGEDDDNFYVLSEIDGSGNFGSISSDIKCCYVPATILDLTDLSNKKRATGITGNKNYCIHHFTAGQTWLKDVTTVANLVGGPILIIFGGVPGFFVAAALTIVNAGTETVIDYKVAWP